MVYSFKIQDGSIKILMKNKNIGYLFTLELSDFNMLKKYNTKPPNPESSPSITQLDMNLSILYIFKNIIKSHE